MNDKKEPLTESETESCGVEDPKSHPAYRIGSPWAHPSPERLAEIRYQCGPRPNRLLSRIECRDLLAEIDARGAQIEALTAKAAEARAMSAAAIDALRAERDAARDMLDMSAEEHRQDIDAMTDRVGALRDKARALIDGLRRCGRLGCGEPATLSTGYSSVCDAHASGDEDRLEYANELRSLAALLETKP